VITSIGIIMIYIACLLFTMPMLRKRLKGEWPPEDAKQRGDVTLGKLGLPVKPAVPDTSAQPAPATGGSD
jgi:hypothetical protein